MKNTYAKAFLSAATRIEQARAYARWYAEDYASWLSLQGMIYPLKRSRTDDWMRRMLDAADDPRHPDHEETLHSLDPCLSGWHTTARAGLGYWPAGRML